jgi:TatD DNase family protein
MTFVDIHAHLDFKDFDKDRTKLLEEMKKNNIIAFSNTLNKDNYEYTKELFKGQEDTVKVCPGLYPIDAQKLTDKEFKIYLNQIKKEKNNILAIGEVGLDRYHSTDKKEWEIQEKRFKKLIELGIKLNKPLIIHTRKAEARVLEILKEYVEKYNFRKFVLHCFSGKKKLIKEIRELKLYVSIPLTILNTQSFQILVKELAISQLLVETDSPFLNPNRERNSPLNIPFIYSEIAQIKGLDEKEIENIIYRNYIRLVM